MAQLVDLLTEERGLTMRRIPLLLIGVGASLSVGSCGDGPSSIGESPTGTHLDPKEGIGEHGYEALDETCENIDSPTYMDRFVTPMFRDAVEIDDVVYLVDGSLLWAVSIENPESPSRLSLTRLPGHPLSIEVGPTGHLLVAAGDVGLLLIDAGDPAAPAHVFELALPGLALDVAAAGDHAYVAAGDAGLIAINVADSADPAMVGHVELPGFANAVDVRDETVYVAACSSVSIVDVSHPVLPEVLGTYWVPEGHAKELSVVGHDLFVAGGEALFAFDVSDPHSVMWTGFYADPEAPGFYVNAVVVRDGVAYIAAGDESVRAVDVSDLGNSATYLPPAGDGEPPDLDGPIDLPDPSIGTVTINRGDPINVGLTGHFLLVLGNFRWVGERLLRIIDIATPGVMVDVGSYGQPNQTLGVDRMVDALVVHGEGGTETVISTEGDVIDTFALPAAVVRAVEAFDQLYMLLEDGQVYRYSHDTPQQLIPHSAYDMTIGDVFGYVSDTQQNGLVPFAPHSLGQAATYKALVHDNGFLGFSHLLHFRDHVYAYDWVTGLLHVFIVRGAMLPRWLGMADVGHCEMYDIADFYSGQKAIRARLVPAGDRVAMLCPIDESDKSSVLFFDVFEPWLPQVANELELPGSRYVDILVDNDAVYALGFDNNSYRSTLVRFEGGGSFQVEFDGHANGFLLLDGVVVVADGDFGLRRFDVTAGGFEELP